MIFRFQIIYVARDPRDVAVSNYYHKSGVGIYTGEKNEHFQKLLDDDYNYCSYWDHVMEFWSIKDHSNILFLSYERMQTNLKSVLETLSDFLQKPIPENKIELLLDHLSFENMKANKSCNHEHEVEFTKKILNHTNDSFKFMRKGLVHDFEEEMDAEMLEKFNEWIVNNLKTHHLTLEDLLF